MTRTIPVCYVTQLAYVHNLLFFTNHAKNCQQRPLQSQNARTASVRASSLCKRSKSQNTQAVTDTRFWNGEMASNNGSFGKWEVVKKGKKNSISKGTKNAADKKSGGGGRKALSESNLPTRRKCPWPSGVLLAKGAASSTPQLSGVNLLVRSNRTVRFYESGNSGFIVMIDLILIKFDDNLTDLSC